MNLDLADRRIHLDSSVYIAALRGEIIPACGGLSPCAPPILSTLKGIAKHDNWLDRPDA